MKTYFTYVSKNFFNRTLKVSILLMFTYVFSIQNGKSQQLGGSGNPAPLHSVGYYTPSCGSGPQLSIQPSVNSVNSSSHYRWQYKNASGTWVCINNGVNNIKGISYNVTGAVYDNTNNPGPLVFTNPDIGLEGLVIRVVIYDGATLSGCSFPNTVYNGNSSSVNLTISVSGASCGAAVKIGNHVFWDKNDNGVKDGADEAWPWSGFTVKLYRDQDANGVVDPGWVVLTTTVDGNANYHFSNIPPGKYFVRLINPNPSYWFKSNLHGGDPNNDIDNDNNGVTSLSGNTQIEGLNMTLATGSEPTNDGDGNNSNLTYDFGCWKTNGLGDYVWADDNANGIQEASEAGIPGVNVVLSKGATTYTTSTDANGYYYFTDIEDLANGGYKLTFTTPSGFSPSPANQGGDDSKDSDPIGGVINGITVPMGTWNHTFDAGFVPIMGSIGDKVWNDLNKNGIQDAGEVGLSGVTISLYNNVGNLISSTITDAYGMYKFANLPINSGGTNYQVRFSLPAGYIFTSQNADAAGITGAVNSDANVTTGRTSNVTLTFATPNVTYVDAGVFKTEPNRIGDFVWNDLNKDGKQDVGEPGIAGVTVTLYDNLGNPVRTTVTDNNGYYEFTDVPNGTYTIGVSLPVGYQVSPQDQGGDDAKDSDLNPATLKTAPFVFNGGVNTTFDFGLNVTDPSKASVGDYVWVDLNNDNLQNANEPGVSGVTVQLYNSSNVLVATTTTDVFGYYIFNNVNPGNYYVKFSNLPAGYSLVTADAGANDYVDSDVSNANGAGTTATFAVLADNNYTQYDAGIRANTALNSIGDFVWYDLDKDGIQDAGEAGVPGITVTLYNASTGAVIKTTTTNAQGLYMFTNVPAGSYTVGFSNLPSGYTFTNTGAGTSATDSDPNPNTGRTGTITVAGTGNVITTVDAGLVSNPNIFNAKAALGDKVWNDLNNNGIQDAGEPGIPGVTVTLFAADGTTVIATTTTDALGNYMFSNLNAGSYIVGFSGLPAGYVFGTKDAGSDNSKDSDADIVTGKTGPVTLLAGQINTTVDAGARNTTTLANLGDRVWNDLNGNGFQNTGETGIPGVSVILMNTSGTILKNTVTDANGNYLFTDLAAGTYKVSFGNLPAGFVATTKDATPTNDATDSDADPITLTTGNITLAAGATDLKWDLGLKTTTLASVGDFVWSDVNGNGQQDAGEPGIAGVLVTLYNNSGTPVASAVTDANGKYLFVNVTPGTYTIGFSNLPSGSTFTTKDNGADGTDSDVNTGTGKTDSFTLTAGQSDLTKDAGLIVNRAAVGNYVWFDKNSNGIQDANEPPSAGVTVTLYNSSNIPVGSAVTDGNGYYLINNIPVATGGESFTIKFTDKPANSIFTTKNAAGSTADNNSDANTSTGITDVFTLNPGQIRLDQDAGLIQFVNLFGNVWHDVNALDDNLVNNSGALTSPPAVSIPNGLRVYLVNTTTGLIERVGFVNASNGTYSFLNIMPNTNYAVYLSQQVASVGSVPPPVTLPDGWNHTGQKLGISPGSDGIPGDGKLIVPVFSTDVHNANFGIRLKTGEVVIG